MVAWNEERVSRLIEMSATYRYNEIAAALGVGEGAVRNKLWRLGVRKKAMKWTAEEERQLRQAYEVEFSEDLDLSALATRLGRTVDAVHLRASRLGISDIGRKKTRKPKLKTPKFKSEQERRAHIGKCTKLRFELNGHPRGMKGKRHTAEVKAVIAEKSKRFADTESAEERAKRVFKANQTKARNGTLHPSRQGATWKAGWRDIGGVRKYYRSKWEANYAHYLEWLKGLGEIQEWKHEPKTFWFEGIKRGANSYLPDFWVLENNGAESYHEVKGWMDERSKTKIRRMAKYHPGVKLIVIDTNAYAAFKKAVQTLVPGWES